MSNKKKYYDQLATANADIKFLNQALTDACEDRDHFVSEMEAKDALLAEVANELADWVNNTMRLFNDKQYGKKAMKDLLAKLEVVASAPDESQTAIDS